MDIVSSKINNRPGFALVQKITDWETGWIELSIASKELARLGPEVVEPFVPALVIHARRLNRSSMYGNDNSLLALINLIQAAPPLVAREGLNSLKREFKHEPHSEDISRGLRLITDRLRRARRKECGVE